MPRGRGARREVEMAAHCQGYRWGRTGREVASTTCVARPARMPGRVREGVRHRHCRLYARASNDDGDGARVDGRAAADAVQGAQGPLFSTKGPQIVNLDAAAMAYAEGVDAGKDTDDLLAEALGLARADQLSSIQKEYKETIKAKLMARAREIRSKVLPGQRDFEEGKWLYSRGRYEESKRVLVKALDAQGPFSLLGGDIQMWLALAHQACGEEAECLAIYKALEETHPIKRVRQQAANLRFIMEAPKMRLSDDERVKLALLEQIDRNRGRGAGVVVRRVPIAKTQREMTWEERHWEEYRPPDWTSNRYVWVASTVIATGLAVWGTLQR